MLSANKTPAGDEALRPQANKKTILFRAGRMLMSFLNSSVGGRAKLLFGVLLMLLVGSNGFNVLISYVGRDFMTAIEQRQMTEFTHQAMLMVSLFVISTVAASFARYFEEHLGLLWRVWLTEKNFNQYMNDRTYQFIEVTQWVQHPDQRISEDVRALTASALSFVLMLVNSLLAIIAFSGVLWAISPLLFVVSFLYAVVGSLITIWLGRPLIALNSAQVDREADFRSELLHIRGHAEPIALARQEANFRQRLQHKLEALRRNTQRMIAVNRNLVFFTGNYNYLIQIIPALVVAPFFIAGDAEFGVISQSALAFTILVNAFSLVVSQFPSLSNFAAVITRLSALSEANENARIHLNTSLDIVEDNSRVVYENVTLLAKDNDPPLVHDFSVNIPKGTRVLICGKNKQALLRLFNATSGVENHSTGTLHRPSLDDIYFLPEKPYLTPGTLRQTLVNPDNIANITDSQILAVLEKLDAAHIIEAVDGLDKEHSEWNTRLSMSEQKLVGVARLLLTSPRFAMLLRLRSVLSDERVAQVMRLLKASDITYINLGKYEFIDCYDVVIELLEDGAWTWEKNPVFKTGHSGQE